MFSHTAGRQYRAACSTLTNSVRTCYSVSSRTILFIPRRCAFFMVNFVHIQTSCLPSAPLLHKKRANQAEGGVPRALRGFGWSGSARRSKSDLPSKNAIGHRRSRPQPHSAPMQTTSERAVPLNRLLKRPGQTSMQATITLFRVRLNAILKLAFSSKS